MSWGHSSNSVRWTLQRLAQQQSRRKGSLMPASLVRAAGQLRRPRPPQLPLSRPQAPLTHPSELTLALLQYCSYTMGLYFTWCENQSPTLAVFVCLDAAAGFCRVSSSNSDSGSHHTHTAVSLLCECDMSWNGSSSYSPCKSQQLRQANMY